jgi:hypothetical protein
MCLEGMWVVIQVMACNRLGASLPQSLKPKTQKMVEGGGWEVDAMCPSRAHAWEGGLEGKDERGGNHLLEVVKPHPSRVMGLIVAPVALPTEAQIKPKKREVVLVYHLSVASHAPSEFFSQC